MRRLWLALVVVLFAACHHRSEQQQQASVSARPQTVAADSVQVEDGDTVAAPVRSEIYVLQQDTAELTNLRLFARKQRVIYSPALITGEWLRGSEHEQYMTDGKGLRWDTSDEVYREDAQEFSWCMDSNLLTIRYDLKLGGLMIGQYVVTFVDDETLVYRDAFDGTFMFDKVLAGFADHP